MISLDVISALSTKNLEKYSVFKNWGKREGNQLSQTLPIFVQANLSVCVYMYKMSPLYTNYSGRYGVFKILKYVGGAMSPWGIKNDCALFSSQKIPEDSVKI